MTRFLLAGGGTGGHVNPMLALADAISHDDFEHRVWALGTAEGLEARLVPERGYSLLTVARLPFPRRINGYAFGFVGKFLSAVKQVEAYLVEHRIDVVVGFGGYASAPAYLAARRRGVPIVVHEANALPGMANRWGSRFAAATAVAFRNTKLRNAVFVGMPLRSEIEALAKKPATVEQRAAAREHFGLSPDAPTLLVTGGSLGARSLNEAIEASRNLLSAAGIQVLHIVGDRSPLEPVETKEYVRLAYCSQMNLAIEAADFAVARAGASTVSEFAAVGLPACYVPYPVGNGEQKFNVVDVVSAGGSVVCADADFTAAYVSQVLIPTVSNTRQLGAMAKIAKDTGVSDGADRLLDLVKRVALGAGKGVA
jgi:UDP-N-acetylglucosamine--N-acetylmuramyl-(pentapeptide) pyrophosphoryl-undecaprenol N-acetylglucosamine transferase